MESVSPTLRPRPRLPRGRPSGTLPWRFSHMKAQVLGQVDARQVRRSRPVPVLLGWDEGPDIDRIAWLSVARSLIEAGDCDSYLGALELIPADVWSREELAELDRVRGQREHGPRKGCGRAA